MTPSVGCFADVTLIGLGYTSPSYNGVTSHKGEFIYKDGDKLSFAIGNVVIGSAFGASLLTLADLTPGLGTGAGTVNVWHQKTVNLVRFIRSLAQDTNQQTTLTIDKIIHEAVNATDTNISFDSERASFEQGASAVLQKLGRRLRGVAEARNHLRRIQQGITALRDVQIPLRDGSYLEADVFRPVDAIDGKKRYPVLVRLGVYGRAFTMGPRLTFSDADASEEREDAWYSGSRDDINAYFRFSESAVSANSSAWVSRGYVLVRVDGRGIGGSPGKLDPFSRQEAQDYYDAIGWAASQSWSDGNVGIYGGSYNATIQWNVAALRPPALKAIAPLAGDADGYRDLAYPGGIFIEKYRRWWIDEAVGKARTPGTNAVDFVGGLHNHPWDDGYYHGKGVLSADFTSVKIPVLTAVSQTSWIHSRAGFEAFRQLSSPFKQLLVWDAVYASYMYDDCQKDLEVFFDRHLKGRIPELEPPGVRIVQRIGDGEFVWREAASWPLPGTVYRKLFLEASVDGAIGRVSSANPPEVASVEYSAEVPDLSKDPPMAVFESAPLKEELELTGHFRATVWVSSSSFDADIFVAIRVMDGDREICYRTREPGSAAPLTWGCLKASHRALDPVLSTAERPWHTHKLEDALPLSPGEIVEVEVELMPATGTIAANRRLRVEISPTEGKGRVPGFERAYDELYHHGATNRIFTGGVHASCITLPVVPGQ